VSQVISNYLTNALTYSPATQPVTIEIAPEGKVARVKVLDQGPGIGLEEQAHLWERFYRVPGQTHRSGSHMGLGVGSYLSKTLIEQQGGQVGVRKHSWARCHLLVHAAPGSHRPKEVSSANRATHLLAP
jgi:signal transduction histidine kinase